MVDYMELFPNLEVQEFDQRILFARAVQAIFGRGITNYVIAEGKCLTRPQIKPLSNCVMYLRLLDKENGKIFSYKFDYKENEYEPLCFN